MKKTIISFLLLMASVHYAYAADTYTKGYVKRSTGKYVSGYHHTKPNHTKLDNYSTKGNVNPYTGKSGTVNPNK